MSEKVIKPGPELDVKPDWPSPQELHNSFVPGNLVPPPTSDDGEPIELVIDNNYTAHLGEYEIVLSGNEIFLLNSLLLQRDKPLTADDIKRLGFVTHSTPTPQTVNSRTLRSRLESAYDFLSEQLNSNDSAPLVATQEAPDGECLYYVNPNLVVTDKREVKTSATSAPTSPSKPALDFLIDHGTRAEKGEAGPKGELYARIVTLDRLPFVPSPTGAPIEVAIVDNTTLRIGDKLVRLGSH